MNVLGIVVGGVMMFAILFYGIGTVSTIDENINVTPGTDLANSYNTTLSVTTQTFTFMGFLPYLLLAAGLLGTLMMLAKVRG